MLALKSNNENECGVKANINVWLMYGIINGS